MAWIVVGVASLILAAAVSGVMMTRTPEVPPVILAEKHTGKAVPGETMAVREGDTDWPCYASAETFQDLAKWILLDDKKNVNKTLREAHSINLTAGLQVKIIDADFGRRKVRILGSDKGDAGRECWVTIEALAPGSN
jgi:hypothetical protein